MMTKKLNDRLNPDHTYGHHSDDMKDTRPCFCQAKQSIKADLLELMPEPYKMEVEVIGGSKTVTAVCDVEDIKKAIQEYCE